MLYSNIAKLNAHNSRLLDAVGLMAVVNNDYGSKNPRGECLAVWVGLDAFMPHKPELEHDISLLAEYYFTLARTRGDIYWEPVIKEVCDEHEVYKLGDNKHIPLSETVGFIYISEREHGDFLSEKTADSGFKYALRQYTKWKAGRELVVSTFLENRHVTALAGNMGASALLKKKDIDEVFETVLKKVQNNISENDNAITMTVKFNDMPTCTFGDNAYTDHISAMKFLSEKIKNNLGLSLVYGAFKLHLGSDGIIFNIEFIPDIVIKPDHFAEKMTARIGEKLAINTAEVAEKNGMALDMKDGLEILKTMSATDNFADLPAPLRLGMLYTIINDEAGLDIESIKYKNALTVYP